MDGGRWTADDGRPVVYRRATAADQKQIARLIWAVRINPWGLDWRRFLVAVDEEGNLIGCGQVKPHRDGSRELASIAVIPAWRGRGVARALVEQFLNHAGPPLWLTCASPLIPLYRKFGFEEITDPRHMPVYFRRIHRLATLFHRLTRSNVYLAVMRWP
jgi:N-acetylglutamate synthase-like GNAT family acetyltransferase